MQFNSNIIVLTFNEQFTEVFARSQITLQGSFLCKVRQNSFAYCALVVAFLKVLRHNRCDRCGQLRKKVDQTHFHRSGILMVAPMREQTNKVKTLRNAKLLTLDQVSKNILKLWGFLRNHLKGFGGEAILVSLNFSSSEGDIRAH